MRARTLISTAATTLLVLGAATSGALAGGPAAAASSPRCHTSDLSIRDLGTNGGAGSIFDVLRVKNVSAHTCHTRGFPGLTLLNSAGHSLPTAVHRDGGSHTVVLPSRRSGKFMLRFHEVDLTRGGVSCHSHSARKLRVYPPDETASVIVNLLDPIKPCHGQMDEQAITR